MTERRFVDTNVVLRHLLDDNAVQSPAATRFFNAVAVGDYIAVMSDTVLFETIYVLEKQPGITRRHIRRGLGKIIAMPFVDLPDKEVYAEVLRRYTERPALSFADCFHIVLARKLAEGRLVTFDQAAGKAEGVEWIEPT